MKKIFSLTLVGFIFIMLVGCGSGSGSSSSATSATTAGGTSAKGPFVLGSDVRAFKLNADGTRSGSFSGTTTTDDLGTYAFNSISWSGATELEVSGNYFNENTGTTTQTGVLSAIINVSSGQNISANINIFTDLASKRIKKLMESNATVEEARTQAQAMVVELFDLNITAGGTLEDLDLTQGSGANSEANAELLRVSAAIADNTALLGQLQIAVEDGNVSNDGAGVSTFASLAQAVNDVNLTQVANNLENELDVVDAPDENDTNDDANYVSNVYAPVIQNIANQVKAEDTPAYNLTLVATDEDNDTVTFDSVNSSNPTVVTATLSGNELTLTPQANVSGISTITVTATDGTFTATKTFTVTITPVNDAPVLSALGTVTKDEDSAAFDVALSSTDIDSSGITYSATSSNTSKVTVGVTFDSLTVTPIANANGDVNITVVADDGDGGTDSKTFILTLNPINDAPSMLSLSNEGRVYGSNEFNITLQGSDVDNEVLTYTAVSSSTSVATVTLSTNVMTIVPLNVGVSTITATVKDAANVTITKTMTVTVIPKNITVTADAQSKEYNEVDPALTYVASGLIGSDTLDLNISRINGEDVGTYAISITEVGTHNNYNISFISSLLTITKIHQALPIIVQSSTLQTVGDSLVSNVSAGATGTGDLVFSGINFLSSTGLITDEGTGTVTVYREGGLNYFDSNTTTFDLQAIARPSFDLDDANLSNLTVGAAFDVETYVSAETSNELLDDDSVNPSYNYTLVGVAAGSTLGKTLTGGEFTPDVEGRYIVSVVLNDGLTGHSASDLKYVYLDTTSYTGLNPKDTLPVANGGEDLVEATVDTEIVLDGRHSAVTQGNIAYSWEFVTQPASSTATLLTSSEPQARFTPDIDGVYIVKLSVSDGTNVSTDIIQVYTTDSATHVSGIIDTDTTWDIEHSPYIFDTEINLQDAKLTVNAGTLIIGNGRVLKLDTTSAFFDVNGTELRPVGIKGMQLNSKDGTQPTTHILFAVWDGGRFADINGNGYRDMEGGITIHDSILLNGYSTWAQIWYPKHPVDFRRNIFSKWHDFDIGVDGRYNSTNRFYMYDNVLYALKSNSSYPYDITMWANLGSTARVNNNTIIDTTIGTTYSSSTFDATHNYFPNKAIETIKDVVNSSIAYIQAFSTNEVQEVPDHRKYTPFDADQDGVDDKQDNCPSTPNLDQADGDGNGYGDACPLVS